MLLEAGGAGLTVFGSEINPTAITIARTYHFINIPIEERRNCINDLDAQLRESLKEPLPNLWNTEESVDDQSIKMRLLDLAAVVSDPRQQILIETLIVMADFYKPGLASGKILESWNKLIFIVLGFPFSERPIRALHADARCTALGDSSVDLVVTSPPYINVFNYHQQYRASMEAMQWNLINVAKSEIGSNRKHRGNRFLTVIQFCLDIAQTLSEIARVCKTGARIIFVVGRESSVRGTTFYNGEIVAEVAHRALGFDLNLRQERVFLNRFGQSIYEDILHFSPSHQPDTRLMLDCARFVAKQALELASCTAPSDAQHGIDSAIDNIRDVSSSPLFQLPTMYKTQRIRK